MTRLNVALATAMAVAAISSFTQPAAAAIEYPWCAQYSGEESGGRNCSFVSYQQCMETARGAGAACEVNLFYQDSQDKPKPQPRKRQINN